MKTAYNQLASAARDTSESVFGNQDAQRALQSLGSPGSDNGVAIGPGALGNAEGGKTEQVTGSSLRGVTNFLFHGGEKSYDITLGSGFKGDKGGSVILGHEGTHVYLDNHSFAGSTFANEYEAYKADLSIGRSLGYDQNPRSSGSSDRSYLEGRAFSSCAGDRNGDFRGCDDEQSAWERSH